MTEIFIQAIKDSKKESWNKEEIITIFKRLGELQEELAREAWCTAEQERGTSFTDWYKEYISSKKK
jgi:hypothetical protein